MTGKEKCKYLKELRASIAKAYKIEGFEYKECEFKGECSGTCPACDAEAEDLYMKLNAMGHEMDVAALKDVKNDCLSEDSETPLYYKTQGKLTPGAFRKRKKITRGKVIDPQYRHKYQANDIIEGKIVKPEYTLGMMQSPQENQTPCDDLEKEVTEQPQKKPRGLRGLFKKKK